ncbi:MAG: hypothetical protein ABIJ16_02445, partial [Bacteroidota bacterium]
MTAKQSKKNNQSSDLNITENIKTTDTLKENEKLLRTIAENYPNSFVSIIEKDYTIGFSSGQEFKKLGLDPKSFEGLSLKQVFKDKTDYIQEQYAKSFRGEENEFEMFFNEQYQLYK